MGLPAVPPAIAPNWSAFLRCASAVLLLAVSVSLNLHVGSSTTPTLIPSAEFEPCLAQQMNVECASVLFDPKRNQSDSESERVHKCRVIDCQLRAFTACGPQKSATAGVQQRVAAALQGIEGGCPEFQFSESPSGAPGSNLPILLPITACTLAFA